MQPETLKNLAEQIVRAGEVWQEWAGQVGRALAAIAEARGLSLSVDYKGVSVYVALEREDGEGGLETVCQVRSGRLSLKTTLGLFCPAWSGSTRSAPPKRPTDN